MSVRQRNPALVALDVMPAFPVDLIPAPLAGTGDFVVAQYRIPSRAAVAAAIDALINLLDAMEVDLEGDGADMIEDDRCPAGDDDLTGRMDGGKVAGAGPGDPDDAEDSWDCEHDYMSDAEPDHDDETSGGNFLAEW